MMGRKQKILTTVLWGMLVLMMLAVISLRGRTKELPVLYASPAFSLTDQNGKPITNADLRGHVWAVDFIFTHCAGPCPIMTAKMAELQKHLPNSSVKIVSVSVDPERDTPDVLKSYAQKYNADGSRWYFLTGKKSDVFDFAAGMKLTAKPADADSDILHDERILLIDQQGDVRGIYHSKEPESLSKLASDAEALAAAGGNPS
jgi:cytochrome oxidase Cu insertion factor (SCO1/SenC/PrrC family)